MVGDSVCIFFFFKQKTAYELRISDWSSDVCSSDLAELNTDWSAAGDAELADVIALRRAIHAEPEIGLHCPRTTEKLKAAIADLPLEIREGPSTTGFVAILRGGSDNGRTVLLRGDMDALPMQEETGQIGRAHV